MIYPLRTHSQYLEFFQTSRDTLDLKIPAAETHLWCRFRRLNLFASHPILAHLYAPDLGCPALPPEVGLPALGEYLDNGFCGEDDHAW